jgi:hypothetical protein
MTIYSPKPQEGREPRKGEYWLRLWSMPNCAVDIEQHLREE